MLKEEEFKTGYFDPQTSEYVLEDPRPPMPWMHYLFNKDYTALVSVTGGGYSFYQTARDRRLLRIRLNNVPWDRPGRYLYIRNRQNGDFFSAGWAPVMKPLDQQQYRCRLGAGYMTIDSSYKDLETSLTFLVPPEDSLEIWRLQISNKGPGTLELDLFSYVEFALFDAINDRDNYQYSYNIASCFPRGNTIIHNTNFSTINTLGFFSTSAEISGFDCDREHFIGGYHTEANPRGVIMGKLSDSRASGGNPCGAHQIPLRLSPGEKREVLFLLGFADSQDATDSLCSRYFSPGYWKKSLDSLKQNWNEIFRYFRFETPSLPLNLFSNFWHPYQMRTTFYQSRGTSIYEGGIGRGLGYRDSNQDTLGPAYQLTGELKGLLSELLCYQFPDGHAVHDFFRLSHEGHEVKYSDDHLWLLLSVTNYLKESGDMGFLAESLPFYHSREEASVLDHLRRALNFTWNNCGEHGMPLAFYADWNDCLNLQGPNGRGESVWTGFLYQRALLNFKELCLECGETALSAECDTRAAEMKTRINQIAWDSEWYIRAYNDDGEPIGTASGPDRRIFLNSQSWAVYSEVASRERGFVVMDAVREHCNSPHGLTLLHPGFKEYNHYVGSVSIYPAGLKENGGVFCHANTWAIIAECMLGRGDYAMEYYRKLLPPEYNKNATLHRSEPYVYSQFIAGPEHPDSGVARNSWLTGTASWMFIAFTQYILGIQPQYHGLLISPCIPSTWSGYKVTRWFRDVCYNITVENPDSLCCGVKRIWINGKESDSPLISCSGIKKGETLEVRILLGNKEK